MKGDTMDRQNAVTFCIFCDMILGRFRLDYGGLERGSGWASVRSLGQEPDVMNRVFYTLTGLSWD